MRLMYVILTFILVASFGANLNAQERNCAAMNHLEQEISTNPDRINTINAIEEHTQRFIANGGAVSNRSVITIPIVFHVVYRTSAENISDAQLMSQLQVLNDDFRRLNSDADNTWSQAADAEIEFCLATVDPNGNPTTGITRTQTTKSSFGTNNSVKYNAQGGKDAWPRNDYLNFWVCNIGGGILGYAQFPGGAAATDGVVNDYRYTGSGGTAVAPFDLGRTATHEVGHWLNLRHIWGDGGCGVDDFVSDTPASDASNGGCNTSHVSCGTVDMVQNYMDYSNDACMNLFTQGQKARMQALFAPGGARVSLLSSNGCNGGGGGGCTDTEVVVTINSDNYGSETTWTVTNSSGQVVASGGPYGNNATNTETLCLADGCYDFQINDSYGDGICCSYGNGSYSVTSGGSTLASGGQFGSSETTNFCIGGGSGPTCTDGIQNGDEEGVDCGGSNCAACPPPPCTDITLSLTFDNYASETSWQITNSAGSVIGSGSGYGSSDNNQTINLSGCLDADCYTFTINDSYGDGICCSYGNGSYSVTDGSGTVLISGGQFGSSESKQFCVGGATRVDESARQETAITADNTWEVTKLYPNPVTNQLFIDYVADVDEEIQVTVFDILGKVIIERNQMLHAGYNKLQLDVTRLEAGYHLVKIQQGETQFTQKFIKH